MDGRRRHDGRRFWTVLDVHPPHGLEHLLHQQRDRRVAADVRFHELLAETTGNPVFTVLLKTLGGLLGESRRRTIRTAGVEPALIGHREILAAVERHDPHAADAAMRRHLDWAEDDIRSSGTGAKSPAGQGR
jgi:DNA-binding FadR family transcriptional regulator